MPSPRQISFTVPLVPPSVNHYKMRTNRGVTFVSAEAKAFKLALYYHSLNYCPLFGHGESKAEIKRKRYSIDATVYFGKGGKGDGDNLWKCIGDGLKEAGVIHSDAAVSDWLMHVRRDPGNPRTEIVVTAL